MCNLITAFAAAALMTSSAVAQPASAAPAAKTPVAAPVAKTTKAPVARTAKSFDCSKQADAKGLHGKQRKSFMSSCKKA